MILSLLIAVNCISPAIHANSTRNLGDIQIEEANFPDENFREWLSSEHNLGGIGADGTLSSEELAAVTEINIPSSDDNKILSLDGIEHFTALKVLNIQKHGLTELDLSSNTNLENLNCSNNSLTSLNLGTNTNLKILNCTGNKLADLDISENTGLINLFAESNALTSIDLEQNTLLETINLNENKLQQIDLSSQLNLVSLQIDMNNLTTLDLSNNTQLETFFAQYNNLNEIKLPTADSFTVYYSNFKDQSPMMGYDTVNWYFDSSYQTAVTGDIQANGQTLYGKRQVNTYKVQYYANGGSGCMVCRA